MQLIKLFWFNTICLITEFSHYSIHVFVYLITCICNQVSNFFGVVGVPTWGISAHTMPLSVIIFRLPGMGKYMLGSSVMGLASLILGGRSGSVTSSIRKIKELSCAHSPHWLNTGLYTHTHTHERTSGIPVIRVMFLWDFGNRRRHWSFFLGGRIYEI